MTTEKEIKQMEKSRQSSAKAIPIYTCFLIAAAVGLWVLGKSFVISIWITIIVLGLTAFRLGGDIYNYFYCGRKLRALKHYNPT